MLCPFRVKRPRPPPHPTFDRIIGGLLFNVYPPLSALSRLPETSELQGTIFIFFAMKSQFE